MRRPRSFWEARVAELAQGRSVERVSHKHGETPARLRWWRWRLGTGPTTTLAPTRMVEIVPTSGVTAGEVVRVLVGDVVLELPASMAPADIGSSSAPSILGQLRIDAPSLN